MATLLDFVHRLPVPAPWQEGDNIPWDEPGFSQRMLAEHLSQHHDAASRRFPKIEEQVAWIHTDLLAGRRTRLLDLCCGPGLYTSRLAALGHECTGIDFSPASIAYAEEQARASRATCRYLREDVRRADFGRGYGLVMMVYGQFNVFRREEARALLVKAHQALEKGGLLLLEPHTLDAVARIGAGGASWYTAAEGLFSPQPHLLLEEHFWDEAAQAATRRFAVIDAATANVTQHALTTQGYTDEEYAALLTQAGFTDLRTFPSLTGHDDPTQPGFLVLTARA